MNEGTYDFGMDKVVKQVIELLSGRPQFENSEGSNTKIKNFFPDPEYRASTVITKSHLPLIEVKESTENFEEAGENVGIGQILLTYNLDIYVYSYDFKSAEESKEFCRKVITNLECIFTIFHNGLTPGDWLDTSLGTVEYLMVKLTENYWGVAAMLPVTITRVVNVDAIRSC